jgi:Helix-turn-helix domain
MEHIAGRIAEIARNIEIVGADPVTRHGFTQVPNFILTKKELSVGAKLAYAMLLKYAWADDACFPGQIKLAEDMGAGERSIRTYLKELETAGLLEITQRGLGRTNLYRLFLTVKKEGYWASPCLTGKICRS